MCGSHKIGCLLLTENNQNRTLKPQLTDEQTMYAVHCRQDFFLYSHKSDNHYGIWSRVEEIAS